MVSTLAMFPGQGSQYVGMGKQLVAEFSAARLVFEEAEDAAGIQIRRLCFDGPEEELLLTANTQPCILATSVAVWRVLTSEIEFKPHYFAGHSLGEYSALVAAGKLSLFDAVRLVRRRGEEMQRAVPAGKGAMIAAINAPVEKLDALCVQISSSASRIEVANYNSPQQIILSGHAEAVREAAGRLEAEGIKVVSLPVSAPFHSSLMSPAKLAMEPLLQGINWSKNPQKIIANLTGVAEESYDSGFLIEQIDHPVKWMQSVTFAHQAGCEQYVEIGPGKVLFGLARRILPRGPVLQNSEDIKALISALS